MVQETLTVLNGSSSSSAWFGFQSITSKNGMSHTQMKLKEMAIKEVREVSRRIVWNQAHCRPYKLPVAARVSFGTLHKAVKDNWLTAHRKE